jgi:hypothetical protein
LEGAAVDWDGVSGQPIDVENSRGLSIEPFHNINGVCGEAQRIHDAQKLVLVDRVKSDGEVDLQHKEVFVVALGIFQRHDQHGQLLGCALVITEPSLAVAEDSVRLSEVLDRSVDEARPELVDGAGKGDGPIGSQEERVPLVLV